MELQLHAFLKLEQDGRFNHGKIVPGTHKIGCWVGPRDDLDAVAKKVIPSLLLLGNEPRSSSP